MSARAATQLAETLLAEPVDGAAPPILSSQKAWLQDLLAQEREMRDKLASFSISETEEMAIVATLEQVEVAKSEAIELLGRTFATHQAESLLTEAVATSTPVVDREKERLQSMLAEERALHAQLEVASDATRQKLQAAKVETSQRLGQQLYGIQAEQKLVAVGGSMVAAVLQLPSLEKEREKINKILAEERVVLAAKASVNTSGSAAEVERVAQQLEQLAADKRTASLRVGNVEQAHLERGASRMLGSRNAVGDSIIHTSGSSGSLTPSLMIEVEGEEALRNDLQQADVLIQNLGANNRALEEQVSKLGSNLFKTVQEKDQVQKQLAETLKAVR